MNAHRSDEPQSRANWMFIVAAYPDGPALPTSLELSGAAKLSEGSFTVDWVDEDANVLLHLGVRSEEGTVVLNSFLDDGWGKEVVVQHRVRARGDSFRLRFDLGERGFRVSADGRRLADFAHRASPASIREVRSSAALWRVLRSRGGFGRRRQVEELQPPRSPELEAAIAGSFELGPSDLDWFSRCWLEWRTRFDPPRGAQAIFRPAQELLEEDVRHCRVLPNRIALLEELPKGGICAEIGTLYGEFAARIWQTCRPSELHLFDLDFIRFHDRGALPLHEGVTLHAGDSAVELETLPDAYFDWIYIDGDHSYDGVARDIAVASRKVKPDGMLVFNDYTFWGPLDFVPYGVVQGVNRLCREEGWEFAYFCFEKCMYCDVALRRSSSSG